MNITEKIRTRLEETRQSRIQSHGTVENAVAEEFKEKKRRKLQERIVELQNQLEQV